MAQRIRLERQDGSLIAELDEETSAQLLAQAKRARKTPKAYLAELVAEAFFKVDN